MSGRGERLGWQRPADGTRPRAHLCRRCRCRAGRALAVGLAVAALGVVTTSLVPATVLGHPAARRRSPAPPGDLRRAGGDPAANPSVAACARALSRHGGPVLNRTPDGEVEQELPAACGGGYERRSRTRDLCRDGCFVRGADRQLAVAGRFREGNLVVVFSQLGRRLTPQLWLQSRAGEVQLFDDAGAERLRRSFLAVYGVAASQPVLQPGEQVVFYVLSWLQGREGWRGELAAAVRSKSALRLAPVATVASPGGSSRTVSRSPAVTPAAPPP